MSKLNFTELAAYINRLIDTDFPKLVQLLYRADINEQDLKELLRTTGTEDAGNVIARLLIERQQQKTASKKQFKRDDDIPENEKW